VREKLGMGNQKVQIELAGTLVIDEHKRRTSIEIKKLA